CCNAENSEDPGRHAYLCREHGHEHGRGKTCEYREKKSLQIEPHADAAVNRLELPSHWKFPMTIRRHGGHSVPGYQRGRINLPFQALQVGMKLVCTLISELTTFFQSLEENGFKPKWQARIPSKWRRRLPVQDRIPDFVASFANEWLFSCSHFINHHAERKYVGAGV